MDQTIFAAFLNAAAQSKQRDFVVDRDFAASTSKCAMPNIQHPTRLEAHLGSCRQETL